MNGNCRRCGRYGPLEKHHVFNGPFRKKSEKYGAYVYICHYCHNEPPYGYHFDARADNALKLEWQNRLMQEYGWTKDEFRKEFGKTYD